MVTMGRNGLSSIVLKDTVSLLVRGFDVLSPSYSAKGPTWFRASILEDTWHKYI